MKARAEIATGAHPAFTPTRITTYAFQPRSWDGHQHRSHIPERAYISIHNGKITAPAGVLEGEFHVKHFTMAINVVRHREHRDRNNARVLTLEVVGPREAYSTLGGREGLESERVRLMWWEGTTGVFCDVYHIIKGWRKYGQKHDERLDVDGTTLEEITLPQIARVLGYDLGRVRA